MRRRNVNRADVVRCCNNSKQLTDQLSTRQSLKNSLFPILNLSFNTENCVRRLCLKSKCLPGQCLHKYLHYDGRTGWNTVTKWAKSRSSTPTPIPYRPTTPTRFAKLAWYNNAAVLLRESMGSDNAALLSRPRQNHSSRR
jgi:hypothetical protein